MKLRKRIDGRINSQLGNGTFQHDRRIQVREGRRRSRIGQVVRWHINSLEGRDRTLLRRGDALLQIAHFGGQRRLITDRARRAAQQRGHFRTRLRKAENVVDKQQHVLVLFVAEILRDGEGRTTRRGDARRRLVHLAVNQATSLFGDLALDGLSSSRP